MKSPQKSNQNICISPWWWAEELSLNISPSMKQKDSEPMKKKSSNVFPKKGAPKDWGSCGMLQKNQFG